MQKIRFLELRIMFEFFEHYKIKGFLRILYPADENVQQIQKYIHLKNVRNFRS